MGGRGHIKLEEETQKWNVHEDDEHDVWEQG
jgi:hypothetical protein